MSHSQVGAALLAQLLETAKVYNPVTRVMEPAVAHAVEFDPMTRNTVGIIRLHERTVHALEDDDEVCVCVYDITCSLIMCVHTHNCHRLLLVHGHTKDSKFFWLDPTYHKEHEHEVSLHTRMIDGILRNQKQ